MNRRSFVGRLAALVPLAWFPRSVTAAKPPPLGAPRPGPARVPVNGLDDGLKFYQVHFTFSTNSSETPSYALQGSNDGTNWQDVNRVDMTRPLYFR